MEEGRGVVVLDIPDEFPEGSLRQPRRNGFIPAERRISEAVEPECGPGHDHGAGAGRTAEIR